MGLLLLAGIVAIETIVPNASRLCVTAGETSPKDFVPAHVDWTSIRTDSWLTFLFSYPTLVALAFAVSFALILWSGVAWRRTMRLRTAVEAGGARVGYGSLDPRTSVDELSLQLQREDRRRRELIEPLMGGFAITVTAWLIAVVFAGKFDTTWTRPFLAPPLLVSQNLQELGPELTRAMERSAFHMIQGLIFGTLAGLVLGFLLSNVKALQRWTVWHVAIIAALPPVFLTEVFKQIVRSPLVPFVGTRGETAFKLGIAMTTWAVTWPVLTATALALSGIEAEYRHAIKLLGARSRWDQLRHVDLPVVLPPVLKSLRIGFVIGLLVLIIGEQNGGPRQFPTFGYMYNVLSSDYKIQSLVAFLVFTSALVLLLEAVLRIVEFRLVTVRQRESLRSSDGDPSKGVAEERQASLAEFERQRTDKWPHGAWARFDWIDHGEAEAVRFSGIRKSYGSQVAFEETSATINVVHPGEFVSIIGRSGAGKSTLMKLLLGLTEPDQGEGVVLQLGGLDLAGRTTRAAAISGLSEMVAYVSQRPTLLQHRSVEANLLFGIKNQWTRVTREPLAPVQRAPRAFYIDYTRWLLGISHSETPTDWKWPRSPSDSGTPASTPLGLLIRVMGLADKMRSYPWQLSGGEAQRVQLLRAIILGRPILVMDEAFSGLDQPLKGMIRDAVLRHSKALGTTVLNVSHDRSDVLQVSDRVIFIDEHHIVDDQRPDRLYYRPKSSALAVFLGHTNLFHVGGERDAGSVHVATIRRDEYRGRDYAENVCLHVLKDGAPVTEQSIFIPRSDVNITWIHPGHVQSETAPDEYIVDGLKFTGTHFELQLSKRFGDESLYLDTVVQDDELRTLLRDAGFASEDCREAIGKVVRVSIARLVPLGGAA